MRAPIIAVDFDGVISAYDGWKGPGAYGLPLPGAAEKLQALKDKGIRIIIWTCRADEERSMIAAYLDTHHIPYDTINEAIEDFTGGRKIYADLYVDDRAVRVSPNMPESNWAEVWRYARHEAEHLGWPWFVTEPADAGELQARWSGALQG